MKPIHTLLATTALAAVAGAAAAEQTAVVLYETKGTATPRHEALAFVEIDPEAPDFGEILAEIPLPSDMIAHHVFYNPSRDKAYVTSLGRSELTVFDVTAFPWRKTVVDVPECVVGEDVAFSEKLDRWYLTCMGSSVIVVGDGETDEVIETVPTPEPWPHGVTVRDDLGRILATSTEDAADPTRLGDSIVEFDLETMEHLATYRTTASDDAPSSPVEIFFVPGAEPPVAYVTNAASADLWLAEWQPGEKRFDLRQVFDFAPLGQEIPLEVYFDEGATRAFVTTTAPGHVNAFDITDPLHPKHIGAAETAPGAHHLAFSDDGRLAFVQNGLANIEGINDGSISVVELATMEKVGSIDTFKDAGFTVNMIELLPDAEGAHSH